MNGTTQVFPEPSVGADAHSCTGAGDHEALTGLAELTARLCGVPIAWIQFSNLPDRCVFPATLASAETAFLDVLCEEIKEHPDPVVIEEIASDRRFAEWESLLEQGRLRSFLGVRVTTDTGKVVGALGIADRSAKRFEGTAVALLGSIARQALAHWRLIGAAQSLALANQRLREELSVCDHGEHNFRALLEAGPDATVIADSDGRIVLINSRTEKLFGYSRHELFGKQFDCLVFERRIETGPKAGADRHGSTNDPTVRLCGRRTDGSEFPAEVSLATFETDQGTMTSRSIRDVSDRHRMLARMRRVRRFEQRLVYRDPVTGLSNRRAFYDRLSQALAQAKRYDRSLAVLFLDLDGFKRINNTLGHRVGDLVLKAVARRLEPMIRECDTVARLGGDDFTIVLGEVQGADAAVGVARKVLDVLAQPFFEGGQELFVTGSIGISLYPTSGGDVESLVMNADIAMYRAKSEGKNKLRLFDPVASDFGGHPLALESALRRALDLDEFVLHYQPQIDLKTGRPTGVEALIRWRHAEMGLVSPARFIPLAEENGQIVPIGEWVLRTACRQSKAWSENGVGPMRVTVNLSARQFWEESLPTKVAAVLEETGLSPEFLGLEITEGNAMRNVDHTIATLRVFRELGVQVMVDDFGTGYSSLSYLKRFPISMVKIDGSFLHDVPGDRENAAITLAIIAMAHGMGLGVIAEGVENIEQLDFLRSLDCDESQGYHIGRPEPASTVTRRLLELRQGAERR